MITTARLTYLLNIRTRAMRNKVQHESTCTPLDIWDMDGPDDAWLESVESMAEDQQEQDDMNADGLENCHGCE